MSLPEIYCVPFANANLCKMFCKIEDKSLLTISCKNQGLQKSRSTIKRKLTNV